MATNDKYDRQLRLWGAKGQRALGDTCVVLIGGTAAGTETLKNLVLPGIGSFCVIDDVLVSKEDVASNFFVTSTCQEEPTIGKKARAQVACENLQELNPDVLGAFQNVPKLQDIKDWKEILYKETNSRQKLLVIASDLDPLVLETLSAQCSSLQLPLVMVQSYGLMGCVKLQLSGKVPLLDPKPANAPPDLRLKKSFPALDEFVQSIGDLSKLESHEHGHVPYPIVLRKAIEAWRASHGGQDPKTFPEKNEFKDSIKNMSRDIHKEVNFEEAIQHAYLAYTEREVFLPEDLVGGDDSSMLAKLFQALDTFREKHDGRLPLNGAIPDMTASTNHYVKLQSIYKTQAEQDLQEMKDLCQDLPEDAIQSFCANVFSVTQMSTRSLVEELTSQPDEETMDDLKMSLMDPYEVEAHTPLLWYLGLRACHAFFKKQGRYPGMKDDESWEADAPLLEEEYKAVALHYGLADEGLVKSNQGDICHELTRYANAELHNVASVVGGVASQEAVKIITGQYIPLNNTYLFNGIVGVGGLYKF
ncbi:unnamed protein product [Cylindrotheca closterium]|uniref:NEDD8-activating enzyme E1 regulatory subunit n=1 Tax=Cylindrotheca closterium TaxID=2856 RepID=A0AAD2CHT1_9STRA|nr:unnamed protein product [Cylindrotheca closterium]